MPSTSLQRGFSNGIMSNNVNITPANRPSVVQRQVQSENSRVSISQNAMLEILKEVKESNSRLDSMATRLELVEGRLKSIEDKEISMDNGAPKAKKQKVPPQVRVSMLL